MTPHSVRSTWQEVKALLEGRGVAHWPVEDIDALHQEISSYLVQGLPPASSSRKRLRPHEGDECIPHEKTSTDAIDSIAELDQLLCRLRAHLKRKVPFGSIVEPTFAPGAPAAEDETETKAVATGLSRPPTYSVDAFLYLEEDIDELVEEGKISREFCRACGSVDIGLSDFITHSFSQDQLVYLTCFLLPAMQKMGQHCRKVVDVGSRLGIVLWAAYFSAKCGLLPVGVEEVVGVEMDKEFFKLQQEIGKRFCSRQVRLPSADTGNKKASSAFLQCRVVESDCFEEPGAKELASADLVILHNVFEYFSDGPQGHLQCWNKLRRLVSRPGQLLLCFPSLEETLEGLERAGVFEGEEADPSSGDEGVSPVVQWISNYVEPIDVSDVADEFFRYRSDEGPGEGSHCPCDEDECCGHSGDHTAPSASSCEESIPELLEQVRNMFVYRVK